jgi:hypothetical protein
MYLEEVVLEYVVCISLALNGDQWRTVVNTLNKHSICISVVNFQPAVCLV